ncbi:MAG: poly-gamma-glutamate synthase PgsB [Candidatus Thermoplasmatota archaeon]
MGDWGGIRTYLGYTAFFFILLSFCSFLGIIGMKEQRKHDENIRKIPIRIHVNGIRGKTTVTRLIGAGLTEAGFKTLTKTTGKAARIIFWDGKEISIRRKGKPNIREQLKIVEIAKDNNVDALVIECMAVQPELQKVCEHKLIHSTIGVITNIRNDHLDVMGPTIDDVARNICNTIPKNGIVVTGEKKYIQTIQKYAKKNGAKVVYVYDELDDEIVRKFSYLNFKENVALALKVCELCGVKKEIALNGMLKAKPDPGVLRIYQLGKMIFINAFGVNDKDSTTAVYNELKNRGYFDGKKIYGLFHARPDRISRTVDFGRAMVKEMYFDEIILVGMNTNLFIIEAIKSGYQRNKIIDFGYIPGEELFKKIEEIVKEGIVFACGNMVGEIPMKLLSIIEERRRLRP